MDLSLFGGRVWIGEPQRLWLSDRPAGALVCFLIMNDKSLDLGNSMVVLRLPRLNRQPL